MTGTQTGTGGFPAIEDAASGSEVQERFRGESTAAPEYCAKCGGRLGSVSNIRDGLKYHPMCQAWMGRSQERRLAELKQALADIGGDLRIPAWVRRIALKARGD